jgi:acyl-coenzyme A thioesterase PaaI-like protein
MTEQQEPLPGWRVELATEGAWAGWKYWVGPDPFEALSGPFYFRDEASGPRAAFRAEQKHMNGGGFMHGGCIMTFADYCLFTFAREALRASYGVTVTLNGEFVGSVHVGDLLEGTGEVVRAGGSLIFVRGRIAVGEQPVMTFSGVIKKVRPRPP